MLTNKENFYQDRQSLNHQNFMLYNSVCNLHYMQIQCLQIEDVSFFTDLSFKYVKATVLS